MILETMTTAEHEAIVAFLAHVDAAIEQKSAAEASKAAALYAEYEKLATDPIWDVGRDLITKMMNDAEEQPLH